jgi:hypothetical protein
MSLPSYASSSASRVELGPPRAFGLVCADLDLDLADDDRPRTVTAVLAGCCYVCGSTLDERIDAAWDLPLGGRIARLLGIVSLTEHSDVLAVSFRCAEDDCCQEFEVPLSFADLEAHACTAAGGGNAEGGNRVRLHPDGAPPITLRLPTGRDQRAWRQREYSTANEALDAVLRSLVVEPAVDELPFSADAVAPLAAVMEEVDPLVAFRISTDCPHCCRPAEFPVDLEAVALQRLVAHRRALLRDIVDFASRFGWSEAEVLAIGAARRAEYHRLMAVEETTVP